jgi:hypothetical protein
MKTIILITILTKINISHKTSTPHHIIIKLSRSHLYQLIIIFMKKNTICHIQKVIKTKIKNKKGKMKTKMKIEMRVKKLKVGLIIPFTKD